MKRALVLLGFGLLVACSSTNVTGGGGGGGTDVGGAGSGAGGVGDGGSDSGGSDSGGGPGGSGDGTGGSDDGTGGSAGGATANPGAPETCPSEVGATEAAEFVGSPAMVTVSDVVTRSDASDFYNCSGTAPSTRLFRIVAPKTGRITFRYTPEGGKNGVLSVLKNACEATSAPLVCYDSVSSPLPAAVPVNAGDVLFVYAAIYSVDSGGNTFTFTASY